MASANRKRGEIGDPAPVGAAGETGGPKVRPPRLVRAAGGIPVRVGAAGTELLVVHRPRYDDWTFPKGKLDPGETEQQCAVREVWEETGLEVTLGADLASVHYVDHRGRPKTVRYWVMAVVGGAFEPNDEVDEVRWVPLEQVGALLTYDIDRALLLDARPHLG